MKLNAKGRYAVMALADLTKHSRGKPVFLKDLWPTQKDLKSFRPWPMFT